MTSLALACKLNAARTPTSLALRALAAIRRAGGTVLAAGAATPVLGPELVTNGGPFINTTGWTAYSAVAGGTISASGGLLVVSNSGGTYARGTTPIPTVAGKTYLLVVRVGAATSLSTIRASTVADGGSGVLSQIVGVGVGTYSLTFVATGSTTYVGCFVEAAGANSSSFGIASAKEIQGYTYGNPPVRNFFDSAGTDILDSVTQVDQPVGLVLDAAGVGGPDRVTDGSNESALFAIQGGTVSSDIVARASAPGGGFAASSISTTSASTAHRFYGISPMLAGKTYQLSGRFYVPTGGIGSFKIYDNADGSWFGVSSSTKDQWVPFSVIRTPKATNWDLGIGDNVANVVTAGQVAFWIDDLSITELTGNHATQPTTGSKPTLRRGLLNQLLWSGDFSNAAWTKTNASPLVGQLDPYGGTSAVKLVESATTGAHYFLQSAVSGSGTATAAWVVKAAGRTKIKARSEGPQTSALSTTFNLSSGTVVTGTGSILPLGNDFFLCVANSAGNGNGASGYHLLQPLDDSYAESYAGDGTSGVIFYRAALYQGTVTAQQILAAGGIPLTTTAPASSALGKYWFQYDPAAPGDFLQTAITTGNEGWVCAGVTFGGEAAANETVFEAGAVATTTNKGVWLFRWGNASANWLEMRVGNGAAVTTKEVSTIPLLGVPRVVEGGWDASTVLVGVDGVISTKARTGDASPSGTPLRIGAYQGAANFLQGGMSVQVICPTLPPPADRALIRAWVAKQQGQTL